MEQRNLGRSGLIVSAVGLGCNNFGGRSDMAATRAVVHKALDLGVTFFDTSDTYGESGASEEYLGRALAGRRDEIVLASKFARPMDPEGRLQGASRRYIMSAVEASLTRLNTDRIDLYYQHIADPRTPIEETLRALDDLVHQGKVRYIGCSTLSAWQVVEAQWTSTHLGLDRFVACQERYNLLERELDAAADAGHPILRSRAHPVLAAGQRAVDREIPARCAAAARAPASPRRRAPPSAI